MVKPIQSLLLLSYILIALILISFLFPTTNKLHLISPTINAKGDTIDEGFSVKFFSFKDIFIKNKATESKDIGATVALAEKLKTMSKTKIEVKDTLVVQNDSLSKDTLPILDIAAIQQLLSEKYRIQFPDDNPIALHAFFKALNHLKQDSTLIRILHYGDSQIEGDHITGQLRKNFQTQFGGSGVGLLPVFDAAPKSTIACKKSPNWFNYLIFGNKYDKNFPANYGILGSYFSYTPMPKSNADSLFKPVLSDSLTLLKLQQNSKLHQGWFSVEKGWRKDSKINNFNQLTLLYGNVYTPAYVQITTKKDTLIRFLMQPSRSLHLKKIPFKGELSEIKVSIKSEKSPQIYGMALDKTHGIAVDNIAFRGSSGTEFTRMNMTLFGEEIKKMNVKLLILQFGVNVAAGKQIESYDFYEKLFTKQLALLKRVAPELSILVVSLSDMAYKEEGVLVSRPSIEKVRNAQRNAAFANGCAFWDLYEAMGGHNSMVSWVSAKPPLAQADYTHFNTEGSELVGEMLYNALLLAYAKHNKLIQ